jgi:hypothetical protein
VSLPAPGEENIVTQRFEVVAYAGYRGEQEPRALIVDGERFEVIGVDDRWQDPGASYFKVAASDGRVYLVRRDTEDASWSLVQIWQLDA